MVNVEGLITGLHHITLVTKSETVNRRFYTEILGLRRVKLTVNQDDIYHRHLFYADEGASPGGTITFFEWPTLSRGSVGLGSPHHLAYSVKSFESLLSWKSWLTRKGVPTRGPYLKEQRVSVYLKDPDGVLVELTWPNEERLDGQYVEAAGSSLPTQKGISNDMRLSFFDHASPVSTDHGAVTKFFEKVLALQTSYVRPNPDDTSSLMIGVGSFDAPDFLTYLDDSSAVEGRVGAGSIHHIAVSVEDEEAQRKLMVRLGELGITNSGIVDRFWFRSLYFRDVFGNLLEIATKGPGYAVDEPPESLGTRLALPPWLESYRASIEKRLVERDRGSSAVLPPSYEDVPDAPERPRF